MMVSRVENSEEKLRRFLRISLERCMGLTDTVHGRRSCRIHQYPAGFGITSLSKDAFSIVEKLHRQIIDRLPHLVHWGSDNTADRRQRGYAMIEGSDWSSDKLVAEGIRLHEDGPNKRKSNKIHNYTIQNCFTVLALSPEQREAVEAVITATNRILGEHGASLKSYERKAVSFRDLVAIQPNLHNGEDYLPLHLDMPRGDGFGVVIVTVAIKETAMLVLVDEGDYGTPDTPSLEPSKKRHYDDSLPKCWSYLVSEGDLYVLSGYARNKCCHGVMRTTGSGGPCDDSASTGYDRQSLNFRFSIHSEEQAEEDILRHWS